MAKYGDVKLPWEVVEWIDEFKETEYAKRKGLKSRTDVVLAALREYQRIVQAELGLEKFERLALEDKVQFFCDFCNQPVKPSEKVDFGGYVLHKHCYEQLKQQMKRRGLAVEAASSGEAVEVSV